MKADTALYEIVEFVFCRPDLQAILSCDNIDIPIAIEKIIEATAKFLEVEREQVEASDDDIRIARSLFSKLTAKYFLKFDGSSTYQMVRCFERARTFCEYMDDYRTLTSTNPLQRVER